MALADTANLLVKLSLGGNFLSQIGKATTGLNKFDKKLGQTESRAFKAGQQIGTGIKNAGRLAAVGVGFLVSQVALGLNSLIELEKATAQTNAVIKSTAGIAGVTGAEVTRLSEKFEALNATVGDEFIRAGQNMLLTFTNIRGKAFEPALEAALNMNTAMGKGPEGLTSTMIQVGKALNDPIKGITALRKVGVSFTEEQQKQIKVLIKQNDLYGAQKIILAELNKEFGGSFAAQGDTTAGKVAKFTDSIEDLQRALAEALLPSLGNVADALSKTFQDPKVVQGVKDFGKSLASLISPANLAEGGRILSSVFDAARQAAPTLMAAANVMGQVVGTAVKMFNSLPKEIQQLAIGAFAINKLTGGLVTNIAGGLISAVLKQLVSGVVNVSGGVVNVAGGGTDILGGGKGILGKILSVVSKVFVVTMVAGLVSEFADEISGFAGDIHDQIFQGPLDEIGKSLEGVGRFMKNLDWPFGPNNVPTILPEIFGGNGLLGGKPGSPTSPAPSDWFDKLKQTPAALPIRPTVVDSPRTSAANLKDLEAILARGRAAGFKPTWEAALATNQKNLSRLAEAQLAKTEAVRAAVLAGDTRSEIAGVRNAIAAAAVKVPTTNVTTVVHISAAQVARTIVIQKRYGPGNGSRGAGPQRFAEHG